MMVFHFTYLKSYGRWTLFRSAQSKTGLPFSTKCIIPIVGIDDLDAYITPIFSIALTVSSTPLDIEFSLGLGICNLGN